jgi:hypothetical protein
MYNKKIFKKSNNFLYEYMNASLKLTLCKHRHEMPLLPEREKERIKLNSKFPSTNNVYNAYNCLFLSRFI